MSTGACNCCESPPCPAPYLECVTATAPVAVCGELNPADGLYYSVATETRVDGTTSTRTHSMDPETGECSMVTVCAGTASTSTYTYWQVCCDYSTWDDHGTPDEEDDTLLDAEYSTSTYEDELITTVTYDGSCTTPTVVYSGNGSFTNTVTGDTPPPGYSSTWHHVAAGEIVIDTGDGPPTPGEQSATLTCEPQCSGTSAEEVNTVTHDPPLLPAPTTAYSELVGEGIGTFSEYPPWEDASGSCYAARSGGEVSKVKWRVSHLPTGTCYLRVWVVIVTTPASGPPTTSAPVIYTWAGTGNPCLPVPSGVSVSDPSQLIHGAETEETYPDEEGASKEVRILKYSCVEGYEPDISDEENPQLNGYPDPTWEPLPP